MLIALIVSKNLIKKLLVLLFKSNACTVKLNSSYLASDYYIETVELAIR